MEGGCIFTPVGCHSYTWCLGHAGVLRIMTEKMIDPRSRIGKGGEQCFLLPILFASVSDVILRLREVWKVQYNKIGGCSTGWEQCKHKTQCLHTARRYPSRNKYCREEIRTPSYNILLKNDILLKLHFIEGFKRA